MVKYSVSYFLKNLLLLGAFVVCTIATAQTIDFGRSELNFNGHGTVNNATALEFGPDNNLYVVEEDGLVKIYTIQQNDENDYVVNNVQVLNLIQNIPNHNDDGSAASGGQASQRQVTGVTVVGTASNPIVYVSSSDRRRGAGGSGGDANLDTNSGIITRLTLNGATWEAVDIIRGLPRSEENHATNGMVFRTINGIDYLLACSGGFTNAGSPSNNFAKISEYALSGAVLSINITMLEAMEANEGLKTENGRNYVYDIPTLDDPTRANIDSNGNPASEDPNDPNYSPLDINDPWGGNDGLNMGMLVPGSPVQIFSAGYRNTYDMVVTVDGHVYVTDNGSNRGWGGYPNFEGDPSLVNNNFRPGEPGGSSPDQAPNSTPFDPQVNNSDHLDLVSTNIDSYLFDSVYGGHPCPVRANENAGLYTNGNHSFGGEFFRTKKYDPDGSSPDSETDPSKALPANWPPVHPSLLNPDNADYRQPTTTTGQNPDGPDDIIVINWNNNTNGIAEYTASNFNGTMQGDLIAGQSGQGTLHRVDRDTNGNIIAFEPNKFSSGGNPLGLDCQGDNDIFPGTIWVANYSGDDIVIFEPNDSTICILPGEEGYNPLADNDSDGYSNEDEELNGTDMCSAASQPSDFDNDLISDLLDLDDDGDGIDDENDALQLGAPFDLPVINELFLGTDLGGFLGLGFTGLMNNGNPNPNYLNWLDDPSASTTDTDDILGGAIGATTMFQTTGDAITNDQEKAFQYGVNVDSDDGQIVVHGRMFPDFHDFSATESQGIFIGNGFQDDYVKLVLEENHFLSVRGENNGNSISYIIPTDIGFIPDNFTESFDLFLVINTETGSVQAKYAFNNGASIALASPFTLQENVLTSLQNTAQPLIVGIIGTADTDDEFAANWDFLNVVSITPFITQVLPDISEFTSSSEMQIDLSNYFDDDEGVENLVFNAVSNNNEIVTSISGSVLTISYLSSPQEAEITVTATDQDNFSVNQTFNLTVTDESVIIYRVNVGDVAIAATDDTNPDWEANEGHGMQFGDGFNVNTGRVSIHNINEKDSSVPSYVPQGIFTKERWDPDTAPEMEWTFALSDGAYIVRLYMGNGFDGTSEVGQRVFDISLEGVLVEDNIDLVAEFGHQIGGMKEYQVEVADGSLNILFGHVVENPLINGIEILGLGSSSVPPINVEQVADQVNALGEEPLFSIIASGGDANESFTYQASGLPPGLSIEATNGSILGVISSDDSAIGTYDVSITVSKPSSQPITINFTWSVTDLNQWIDQTDDEAYTARHECSFVQAGDRFYLFGGRENPTTLDVYNYQTKTWSPIPDSAPIPFNHFQATEYNGLIWVIGAFKDNSFPNEMPEDFIWAYNPATDAWIQGPEIPQDRKRGSTGLVVYNNKFYVVAGNKLGHNGQYVKLFDEFDPATGIWTPLADAPRERDHFHAAVVNDKLYVVGGRLSGGPGGTFNPLIAEVDVYDFATGTWDTLPSTENLPTPRAAPSVGVLDGELFVIGGEIENTLDGTVINDALAITEVYNPSTNTWSTKADLITKRHGTQGIVSGNGIHVAAGSDSKGGGRIHNMEYYGVDNPVGDALIAGVLDVATVLGIPTGESEDILLSHVGGNTGILISNIQISGENASAFNIGTSPTFGLLGTNESSAITVHHTGVAEGDEASMTVTYDGGKTATINLFSGEVAEVLYRVNSGGVVITALDVPNPDWSLDTGNLGAAGNSPYLAAISTGNSIYAQTAGSAYPQDIDMSDPSLQGTNVPVEVFETERFDEVSVPEMLWSFPIVPNTEVEVRLYFAEIFSNIDAASERVFDIAVEGTIPAVFNDVDAFARNGAARAFMLSHTLTVTDGTLDIAFIHGIENPTIKAIEILTHGIVPIEDAIPIEVISQIPNQTNFELDVPVDVSVVASGGDGGLNYTASGLPTGLTINASTGIIEGTIGEGASTGGANEDGHYFVTITLDDADTTANDQVSFNFSWIVFPFDQTSAPVVTAPPTQGGVEGAEVSLQILASGDTDCGDLMYSATGLPPSLDIDSNTGQITGVLDEASASGVSGAFMESNGIVLIEAETDFVNTPGGWEVTTDNGTDFLSATSNHFNDTNGEMVTYDLQITTPGVYRFHMKSAFTGSNPTDENDTWFKIENTQDVHFFCSTPNISSTQQFLDEVADNSSTSRTLYYPAGNAQGRPNFGSEGPGNNGFFKIYRSGGGGNKWDGQTIDNHAYAVYAYFPNPGTYTLSMAERSAGHQVDKFAFVHIDEVGPSENSNIISLLDATPQSEQNQGMVIGAAENSPYNVVVTVTDACVPQRSGTAEFDWIVSLPQSGVAAAELKVGAGSGLSASTFTNGSFEVTNTGDINIISVVIDLSTSFMSDIVWNPVETAEDNTSKCLEVNSSGGTGYLVPVDNCKDPFSNFHNGFNVSEGYDVATLDFTDFNSGETFTFSAEIDPTSIKNDSTDSSAGAVSGFELIGSSVMITFADGTILRNNLFDEGSLGGSQTILMENNTPSAPSITVQGVEAPAIVPDLDQTILVQGTPNTTITILQVDSRLFVDSESTEGPFDIDPFEANEAVDKVLYSVILDNAGNAAVPVTLLQTLTTNSGPDAGINHFIAVAESNGITGPTSNVIVLEYEPNAALGDLEINYTLQGRTAHDTELVIQIFAELAGENDTPLFVYTPTEGSIDGVANISGLEQGTYQIAVKVFNYLQAVQTFTIVAGANSINMGEMLAGDANNDNVVNQTDFSIVQTVFGTSISDENYDENSDFNGDGSINPTDLSFLSFNFGLVGDKPSN